MTSFILVRLGRALLTVLIAVTFVFLALRLTGDPAVNVLGVDAEQDALEAFRLRWGLDRSLPEQFFVYLQNMLSGDFGLSYADGRPAIDVVLERLPKTLVLTLAGFVLLMLIGVPAGIAAALRRNSPGDRAVMSFAVASHSLPSFLLALALIYIFAVYLRILPSSGSTSWRHAILPIATYALIGSASIARFTRSALIEVLDQPYIRAAKASGVPHREIIFRHALPNAAIPLVTILGFKIAGLLGGSVVVETVFAWPGLGNGFVRAIGMNDLSVVQLLIILFTAFMVSVNFAVDVLYALINPRIRLAGRDAY